MTNENNNKAQQLREGTIKKKEEDEAKLKQDLINFYPKADTMKITTTTSTRTRRRRTKGDIKLRRAGKEEKSKEEAKRKKGNGRKCHYDVNVLK